MAHLLKNEKQNWRQVSAEVPVTAKKPKPFGAHLTAQVSESLNFSYGVPWHLIAEAILLCFILFMLAQDRPESNRAEVVIGGKTVVLVRKNIMHGYIFWIGIWGGALIAGKLLQDFLVWRTGASASQKGGARTYIPESPLTCFSSGKADIALRFSMEEDIDCASASIHHVKDLWGQPTGQIVMRRL